MRSTRVKRQRLVHLERVTGEDNAVHQELVASLKTDEIVH
jgi:hypothetical protein